MHLSGDLSLGSILTIATLIGIAITFDNKLGSFEQTLKHHAVTMSDHAIRLSAQEIRMGDLVASVQRLIGQMEGRQIRMDAAADKRAGR